METNNKETQPKESKVDLEALKKAKKAKQKAKCEQEIITKDKSN